MGRQQHVREVHLQERIIGVVELLCGGKRNCSSRLGAFLPLHLDSFPLSSFPPYFAAFLFGYFVPSFLLSVLGVYFITARRLSLHSSKILGRGRFRSQFRLRYRAREGQPTRTSFIYSACQNHAGLSKTPCSSRQVHWYVGLMFELFVLCPRGFVPGGGQWDGYSHLDQTRGPTSSRSPQPTLLDSKRGGCFMIKPIMGPFAKLTPLSQPRSFEPPVAFPSDPAHPPSSDLAFP